MFTHETMDSFLDSCTKEQLMKLHAKVYRALCSKINQDIKEKKYSPLRGEEKTMILSGKNIDAIKAYRVRTETQLLEAKMVVEAYSDFFFD